jgi:hypothetical protein
MNSSASSVPPQSVTPTPPLGVYPSRAARVVRRDRIAIQYGVSHSGGGWSRSGVGASRSGGALSRSDKYHSHPRSSAAFAAGFVTCFAGFAGFAGLFLLGRMGLQGHGPTSGNINRGGGGGGVGVRSGCGCTPFLRTYKDIVQGLAFLTTCKHALKEAV